MVRVTVFGSVDETTIDPADPPSAVDALLVLPLDALLALPLDPTLVLPLDPTLVLLPLPAEALLPPDDDEPELVSLDAGVLLVLPPPEGEFVVPPDPVDADWPQETTLRIEAATARARQVFRLMMASSALPKMPGNLPR
jgi:hypothetical protein